MSLIALWITAQSKSFPGFCTHLSGWGRLQTSTRRQINTGRQAKLAQVWLDLICSFSLLRATNSSQHANAFGMFILFKLEAPGYTRRQAQSMMRNTWQESSWFTEHSTVTWAWGPHLILGTEVFRSPQQRDFAKECYLRPSRRETIIQRRHVVGLVSSVWDWEYLRGCEDRGLNEGPGPDWGTLSNLWPGLSFIEQLVSQCHLLFHSLGPILPQSGPLGLASGVFGKLKLKFCMENSLRSSQDEAGRHVWQGRTDYHTTQWPCLRMITPHPSHRWCISFRVDATS